MNPLLSPFSDCGAVAGETDADLSSATPCVPCDGYTGYMDQVGQTGSCKVVTPCLAGQEEIQESTPQSNRICQACAPGSFNPGDINMCTSHTVCDLVKQCQITAPTATTDRVCVEMNSPECPYSSTTCATPGPDGEFLSAPFTYTSSRVCTSCAPCGEDSETVSPCNETSNYVCAACPVCDITKQQYAALCRCESCTQCSLTDGKYTVSACTSDSDATCSKVTPCDATQYLAVPATATSDNICEAVTPACIIGQYQEAEASATSDTVCRPCALGETDADRDPLTPCVPCGEGHQVVAVGSFGSCDTFKCPDGSADTDQDASSRCEPCDGAFTFQDESGQIACKNVTEHCPPGRHETEKATTSTDKVCSPCPDNTFRTGQAGSASGCLEARVACDGNAECEIAAPTSSADRVCSASGSSACEAAAARISSGGESSPVAVYAGATGAGVLLLILLIVFVLMKRRRRADATNPVDVDRVAAFTNPMYQDAPVLKEDQNNYEEPQFHGFSGDSVTQPKYNPLYDDQESGYLDVVPYQES